MTAAFVRPIRSLFARDARARQLMIEAAMTVAAVRLGLTVMPYKLLRNLRKPTLRIAASMRSSACEPQLLVDAVRIASRHVPRASCLTQAIALHLMMTRRAMQSVIELGVSRRDGTFAAHAWVRHGDVALIGGDVGSYRPLRRAETSK